jgi:hypothetical protein
MNIKINWTRDIVSKVVFLFILKTLYQLNLMKELNKFKYLFSKNVDKKLFVQSCITLK